MVKVHGRCAGITLAHPQTAGSQRSKRHERRKSLDLQESAGEALRIPKLSAKSRPETQMLKRLHDRIYE